MTQTNKEETFTYQGSEVKVLTIFKRKKNPTALIEDKDGNIFPVQKDSLRLTS